jgi:hypothetical protein
LSTNCARHGDFAACALTVGVTKIRDVARKHMEAGAVTGGNTIDRDRLTEILNEVIATPDRKHQL